MGALSAFFAEHSTRIVRHLLADVRFSYYIRYFGEIPRRSSKDAASSVIDPEDISDPAKNSGAVKLFIPDSPSLQKHGLNWMYFYDKHKDPAIAAERTGGRAQVLRPDDEWYVANLIDDAGLS